MTLRLTARHITLLRALVHLASLGFLLWLLVAVPGGLLGGDPVQGLTHYLGKGALSAVAHPAGIAAGQTLAAGAAHQAAPPARALVLRLGRSALYGLAGAGSAV